MEAENQKTIMITLWFSTGYSDCGSFHGNLIKKCPNYPQGTVPELKSVNMTKEQWQADEERCTYRWVKKGEKSAAVTQSCVGFGASVIHNFPTLLNT